MRKITQILVVLVITLIFITAFFPEVIAQLLAGISVGGVSMIIGGITKGVFNYSIGVKQISNGDLRDKRGRFLDKNTKRSVMASNTLIGFLILLIFTQLFESPLLSMFYDFFLNIFVEIQIYLQLMLLFIISFGVISTLSKKDTLSFSTEWF